MTVPARVLYADTDRRGLTATESADVLATIRARLKVAATLPSMPAVRQLTAKQIHRARWNADKNRAMRLIEADMLATLKRCDALEREP